MRKSLCLPPSFSSLGSGGGGTVVSCWKRGEGGAPVSTTMEEGRGRLEEEERGEMVYGFGALLLLKRGRGEGGDFFVVRR